MTELHLLAGAAKRLITPALSRPVFLAGFQPNRPATGIDRDLYARVLAFRVEQKTAVLVALDLIGLSLIDIEPIRTMLQSRGIDGNSVMVACTHTHSGPDTLGLWGPADGVTGRDPGYIVRLREAIVDAALEALTFCCPVQLRAGMGVMPAYIQNYRDPEIVDREIGVVQFVKGDGEVIGTLLNLACHPEVLNGDSTLLSSDYAGVACDAVEQAAGGMALHVSGALGGMLSPAIEERTPAGAQQMGQVYAQAALAALANQPLHDPERFVFRRSRFQLPMQNPLLQQAQELGVLPQRPLSDGMLATECAYLDFGQAQILSIPGELLPRLGFVLKQAMPGPCRILAGITDDELGYILPDDEFVTPQDYRNPGAQYEESMSPGPTTGSCVIEAAIGLVRGS